MLRLNTAFGLGLLFLILVGPTVAQEAARDYPFRPVPFNSVKVDGPFWKPRFETNRDVTVWYDFDRCEETGRIANFARAGGLEKGPFQGIPFNDSDVYKVVEGAAYILAQEPNEKLEKYTDSVIAKMAAAQEPDGYLYTARTIGNEKTAKKFKKFLGDRRWSRLDFGHELYNVGHMYEAAAAYYQATGKRNLLDVAIKNADLICKTFGYGPDQINDVPGHEEIELGLVRLYRVTGDNKYLDQAKFFVDMRGRRDLRREKPVNIKTYGGEEGGDRRIYGATVQDGLPLVDVTEPTGHAVRAGYLYAAAADLAALTDDPKYKKALERIWDSLVSSKLYLTGSVGMHGHHEGFTKPYELPNVEAYNETCAAIALSLWNYRMFLLSGESKYLDFMERTIYNGFLSGISMSGDKFFYPNPLACDMKFKFNKGDFQRKAWFGCSCCPVNIVRFIPSLAGYMYATHERAIYTNFYFGGSATIELGDNKIELTQKTAYPHCEKIDIVVDPEKEGPFELRLRIPGWVRGVTLPGDLYRYIDDEPADWTVSINGEKVDVKTELGFAILDRTWKKGDRVELVLPMPVRRVLANEKVEADRGRVAVERGPLVYCLEGADRPDGMVENVYLEDSVKLQPVWKEKMLGGIVALEGIAGELFLDKNGKRATRDMLIRLIPYYTWNYRGANHMEVWIARTPEMAVTNNGQTPK
jgi:uncharacterized protein